ncbi:hypothetical protein O1W71_02095 [Microbacterium sp. H37-C3]|uniref:hypothetical protein n=1 Tax=Microbacterium sp. H37-C3 TaxID=3004354 RepID=UPI0022AEACBB|nr:hypothetical protein [Microbacterium sp. H37-C3]MCZ4066459.1 hypothetical protein [Microbacterium sp. H37-C3]
MTKGTDAIAAERERQIVAEGYDAEHDAGRAHGLIRAARSYAYVARIGVVAAARGNAYAPDGHPGEWPWAERYWKPTGDPIRDLVKAGALIAAAIDSLTDHAHKDAAAESRADGRFEWMVVTTVASGPTQGRTIATDPLDEETARWLMADNDGHFTRVLHRRIAAGPWEPVHTDRSAT